MGVWPDGYYETFNMFLNGQTFIGADACAYDRNNMLAGLAATQQCFQQSSSVGGLLPSDLDGTTPPPTGSPNYMVYFGTNTLNLYKFHVDLGNSRELDVHRAYRDQRRCFQPPVRWRHCVASAGQSTRSIHWPTV